MVAFLLFMRKDGIFTMEKDFEFVLELLRPDNIFIPKKLAARQDICDEAKLIFSEVYTEQRFGTIENLRAAMDNIPNSTIDSYADTYGKHSSKRIKDDLNKIYASLEDILMMSTKEGA